MKGLLVAVVKKKAMNHLEAKALVDSIEHDPNVSLFVRCVAWLESHYGELSEEPLCYNWGNIITTKATEGKPFFIANDSGNLRKFVCYVDAKEGAEALVSLLRRKYPRAIEAARLADLSGASRGMKAGGYYEAPESRYTKGLIGAMRAICKETGEVVWKVSSSGALVALLAVGSGLVALKLLA